MEKTRSIRVVRINPFLLSNGIILKQNFIIVFFLIFETILTFIMCIDYKFFSHTNLDIFEILNKVGGDIFILHRYFVLDYVDNLLIDTINSYLSDIKNFTLKIPHISEYIEYKNFSLNIFGYVYISISFIITLCVFLLTILQIRNQQKFRTIGLHSIYSPLRLIVFSYLHKDYIYFKRVIGIRREPLNQEKKISLIELFFNKSDLFLNNKLENLELKTETKQVFFGFYNFYRLSLVKK